MTDEQIKVLTHLDHGHIRLSTNWDEREKTKEAFLSLQEQGYIKKTYSFPHQRWYITESGSAALTETINN